MRSTLLIANRAQLLQRCKNEQKQLFPHIDAADRAVGLEQSRGVLWPLGSSAGEGFCSLQDMGAVHTFEK
jgi:hypothetical protein